MIPKISGTAQKYILSLDKPTRKRIADKIEELCKDPINIRTSKPLTASYKRSARVGSYRILFTLAEENGNQILLVSDVGQRGQIYRKA